MAHKKTIAALLFIALSTTARVAAQPHFNKAKLDSLIMTVDKNQKAMGALTVSREGNVIYKAAWGYKAITGKEWLKSDTATKYRVGSISKMFTSVMVLQLVEEKKLKLSSTLADFYPRLPNAKDITIERLLTHHSGLYNFTDSAYMAYHTAAKTHEEMLALFEKQTPVFQPGERAEYSNTNFVLLGYIIEEITGKSYAENLKKRITSKIGLSDTYAGTAASAARNEARSFNYDGEHWLAEDETNMSIPGGAGAVVSTSGDLVKFVEALFAGKLVSKESLARMTHMQDGFGLGIFQLPFDEKQAFGHMGGIDKFQSMVGYFPEDRLAFAYTGNGETIEINDIAIGVLSICFDRRYEIPDYTEVAFTIAAAELARYEGTYSSSEMPLKIVVKSEGDHLRAQATGQSSFPLTARNEKEFKFEPAKIIMQFDIEKEGLVKQFRLKQGGGDYLFVKQ